MGTTIDGLLKMKMTSLNVLASVRNWEAMRKCVGYNSRCWERFMLEAFDQPPNAGWTNECLHLAAVNIFQVLVKLELYEHERPVVMESEEVRKLALMNVRDSDCNEAYLFGIRANALRRKALTTCIRAICSEILGIGNDDETWDKRLAQLAACTNSHLHCELLRDIASCSRKRDHDFLDQTKTALVLLSENEQSNVLQREWRILSIFVVFLLGQLQRANTLTKDAMSSLPAR